MHFKKQQLKMETAIPSFLSLYFNLFDHSKKIEYISSVASQSNIWFTRYWERESCSAKLTSSRPNPDPPPLFSNNRSDEQRLSSVNLAGRRWRVTSQFRSRWWKRWTAITRISILSVSVILFWKQNFSFVHNCVLLMLATDDCRQSAANDR